jgi:hypothetical protein
MEGIVRLYEIHTRLFKKWSHFGHLVPDRSEKEKYRHYYNDDQMVENLARYLKVDKHPEILPQRRRLRKDCY